MLTVAPVARFLVGAVRAALISQAPSAALSTLTRRTPSIISTVSTFKPIIAAAIVHPTPVLLTSPPPTAPLLFTYPAAGYKVKLALKRRCPSCYFVQRGDRLFVECRAKPRHKQMQKIRKSKLFRED